MSGTAKRRNGFARCVSSALFVGALLSFGISAIAEAAAVTYRNSQSSGSHWYTHGSPATINAGFAETSSAITEVRVRTVNPSVGIFAATGTQIVTLSHGAQPSSYSRCLQYWGNPSGSAHLRCDYGTP